MRKLNAGKSEDCYKCRFIENPISIDGNFEKAVWRNSSPINFHVPVTGETPESRTEAGMLWNYDYLYICFKAFDKDIFAYNSERDSATCHDDVLEVFFKVNEEKDPYYNFEINALNTVYDAYNLRRNTAGGYHRWKRWNCEGLKSQVKIDGSINNPYDVDNCWQLEVAIPFAELDLGGKKRPDAGDRWLFNLCRYDYSIYLEEGVEFSSSSKLTKVDFHIWEEWDYLEFIR